MFPVAHADIIYLRRVKTKAIVPMRHIKKRFVRYSKSAKNSA